MSSASHGRSLMQHSTIYLAVLQSKDQIVLDLYALLTQYCTSCAGLNPTIASLSLGGSRDFLMKHKDDAKRKEKFPLESGDMLVMQGSTQSKWLHSIPKRTSSVQPRVNITFRKAMNAAGTNNYYKYNVGDGEVYRMINGKMSQTA